MTKKLKKKVKNLQIVGLKKTKQNENEDSKMKQKKSSTCCGRRLKNETEEVINVLRTSTIFLVFWMSDFKMEITMQNTEKGSKSGDSIFFFGIL